MDLNTLWVFAGASLLLALTPGPTMLLALAHGASGGWRAALGGIAGASQGSSALIALTAGGLGALLQASQALFEALRLAGVLYLAWLAWRLWRAPAQGLAAGLGVHVGMGSQSVMHQAATPRHAATWAALRRSLTVALSNPKTVLFFAAFLPQFVDPARPQALQYLLLGSVFVLLDTLVMVAYAAAGARVARWGTVQAVGLLNRGCALGLDVLAAALLVWRR